MKTDQIMKLLTSLHKSLIYIYYSNQRQMMIILRTRLRAFQIWDEGWVKIVRYLRYLLNAHKVCAISFRMYVSIYTNIHTHAPKPLYK